MPPSPRPSLAPFLTLLVFFSLNLLAHLPDLIQPPHDGSLTRTFSVNNSTLKVTTLRNRGANRCALVRCTAPADPTPADDPACDLVFVEMTASSNVSARLCPVLYLNSQWDALATTYNNGLVFLSPRTHLRHRVSALPLDPKAVHLSVARNHVDLSTAWLAVWPSAATRAVVAAWAREAVHVDQTIDAPEQAALNRVRGCRGADIACHARHATMAWQCDGAPDPRGCEAPPYYARAARATLVSLAVVAMAGALLGAVARAAPRMRVLAASLPGSLPGGEAAALAALGVVALAGEEWPTIVHILARACSVTFRQSVDGGHLWAGDVFRAVPDLRGVYEGTSYIFRDGSYLVRISGPGVSVVVGLASAVFFLKRVLAGGLLVKCAFWMLVVKGCAALISRVATHGKKEVSEEDEYYRRRSEFAGLTKQRKSRSFLLPRETNMEELMRGVR